MRFAHLRTLDNPIISVVCCTHNREAFARQHFEALRGQLDADVELVYALDNCTDATRSTLEALANGHPKVRVLEHSGQRGLFNCRNFGIAHARGAYIHFLDDDDSVEHGFYAQACAGLHRDRSAKPDIYLSRLRITTDQGHVGEREVMSAPVAQEGITMGHELHLKGDFFGPILRGELYFNGSNTLFNKELLQRYGYRRELKKSADWLFILEAALCQPLHLAYNPEMMAVYFVHAASMSIAPDKSVWNARVFDLLLDMALSRVEWEQEIRTRCAKANFDAGYALRNIDRAKARRMYWRSFTLRQSLTPLLAIGKTFVGR